jgi:hypothetical protein
LPTIDITSPLCACTHQVVGVDYSAAFVAAAETMRTEGQLQYSRLAEGDAFEQRVAQLPAGIDCSRVQFRVGDACALPLAELGQVNIYKIAYYSLLI